VTLVVVLGFRGLALGTSIAALANGAVSLWLLHRRLGGIHLRHLGITFAKVTASATAMAWVSHTLYHWPGMFSTERSVAMQAIRLIAAIGLGMVTLAIGGKLLRLREFDEGLVAVRQWVQKLLAR
jgi:putative peptidoglycan lipid II flippase